MKWKQFLNRIRSMGPDEAKAYMNRQKEGDYTLLDVREPGEYKTAHIPGAKLIPLSQLPDRMGELDPRKPLITY
ncbi:MAG: rhodanese-like domain-containing protein [Desulfobacteraceae bacterium]|nr:rhodanese-like domain-containing protein [Desulfobacteraceae bacterium]